MVAPDELSRTPFDVIDAPDRDKIITWVGVQPLPATSMVLDVIHDFAFTIYQLPKTGR